LEAALSSKVGRAASKRARVCRARIKPEAHSYINVKTCTIKFILAAAEDPVRKKDKDRHMSIAPSSQLDFPSATTLFMTFTAAVSKAPSHTHKVNSYQRYIIPFARIMNTKTGKGSWVETYHRLKGVEKERKRFVEYPT
jgi:hypothetical protein